MSGPEWVWGQWTAHWVLVLRWRTTDRGKGTLPLTVTDTVGVVGKTPGAVRPKESGGRGVEGKRYPGGEWGRDGRIRRWLKSGVVFTGREPLRKGLSHSRGGIINKERNHRETCQR